MNTLIKVVANIHKTSEREVAEELQKALQLARKSTDDTACDFWAQFQDNEEISLAEILNAIIEKL